MQTQLDYTDRTTRKKIVDACEAIAQTNDNLFVYIKHPNSQELASQIATYLKELMRTKNLLYCEVYYEDTKPNRPIAYKVSALGYHHVDSTFQKICLTLTYENLEHCFISRLEAFEKHSGSDVFVFTARGPKAREYSQKLYECFLARQRFKVEHKSSGEIPTFPCVYITWNENPKYKTLCYTDRRISNGIKTVPGSDKTFQTHHLQLPPVVHEVFFNTWIDYFYKNIEVDHQIRIKQAIQQIESFEGEDYCSEEFHQLTAQLAEAIIADSALTTCQQCPFCHRAEAHDHYILNFEEPGSANLMRAILEQLERHGLFSERQSNAVAKYNHGLPLVFCESKRKAGSIGIELEKYSGTATKKDKRQPKLAKALNKDENFEKLVIFLEQNPETRVFCLNFVTSDVKKGKAEAYEKLRRAAEAVNDGVTRYFYCSFTTPTIFKRSSEIRCKRVIVPATNGALDDTIFNEKLNARVLDKFYLLIC